MAMVSLIGPSSLCTQQTLPVSGDEMSGMIYKPREQGVRQMRKKNKARNSPLDLKEGDIVKGILYSPLHFCSCGRSRCCMVLILGCTLILLDKI